MLDSREQKGKTVVLIIDEAHLLQVGPLQELRLLTNFKMDSFDPFILILCGQSDLRRIMDYAILEAFSQRLALRYHMPPLSKKETAEYVQHHMSLAGAVEPLFDDSALAGADEIKMIQRQHVKVCQALGREDKSGPRIDVSLWA